MRKVTLLGASGSIGTSTLDVLSRHSSEFELHGVAACSSVEKMVYIVRTYHPQRVAMFDEVAYTTLGTLLR